MPEQAQTNPDPDAIQSDIRRTREQIDQTLDAVQHKLSPGELLHEVLGLVRGSSRSNGGNNGEGIPLGSKARDLMSGLGRTIKDNPVPSALIGLGLISLVRSGDSHSDGLGDRIGNKLGTRAKHAAHKLGDKVQHLGEGEHGEPLSDRISGAADKAREKVGDKLEDARESIGDKLEDARETVEHGYERVRHRIEDDPIVLGALGVALGAALGASLPSTRIEDRMMGDKRDELASTAKQVGEQVREAVKHDGPEATSGAMSGEARNTSTPSTSHSGPEPSTSAMNS
jgi:hypothetical protein